jgi:hypothetical protein
MFGGPEIQRLFLNVLPRLRLVHANKETKALGMKFLDTKNSTRRNFGAGALQFYEKTHVFCRYKESGPVHRAVILKDEGALEIARRAGIDIDQIC